MSAQRKAIRKAIRDLLINKTAAGNKVFTNQSTPTWVEDLPVILIYTRSEDVESYAVSPKEWKRTVNMVVEILARGPEEPNTEDVTVDCPTLDDVLDDIADQVECELGRDDTLKCTVDDVDLSSVEFEFDGEGEWPIGSIRLIYSVIFHTKSPSSIEKQSGVTDFDSANVDWSVGHDNDDPDSIKEANDQVDIPDT